VCRAWEGGVCLDISTWKLPKTLSILYDLRDTLEKKTDLSSLARETIEWSVTPSIAL
jgi:hypothetical protein